MKYNTTNLGSRIREMRKKKNMTQAKLAELCGLTASHISHFEIGSRLPSLGTFTKLIKALDDTEYYLLTNDPPVSIEDQ